MQPRAIAAILLVLFVFPIAAQEDDSDWYLDKTIQDVTFEGLESISQRELRGIVQPYIGEPFTNQRFLEMQRKLYALDYFSEIVPTAVRPQEGEGVIVKFQVTERPLVDELRFEGNSNARASQLLNEITVKTGDIITESKLESAAESIRSYYRGKGFPDVSVEVRQEAVEDSDDKVVVFDIDEGSQVTIREIRFSGNSFASDSTLRGVMDSKAQSLFNRGIYQQSKLEQDREAIEKYYRQRGFIDAEITDIARDFTREEDKNKTFVTITIFVNEGQQFRFGGVDFEGNTIFTDDELRNRVSLEQGEVLNMTQLQSDLQRVADLYYKNGYIFNSINRQQQRNESENTVSFTVDIVERNRAHIENIIIKGNEKTEDFVIRREIPLEVGDIFSATQVRQGLRNLSNLQYFSNITPETPQGSVPGLMDLVLNVEESNTADIRFGVAFGGNTEFPISGQVSWQDRNFLGRGQTMGAELNVSPVNQRLSFNFQEPWLFGYRWSAGANLSVDRTRSSDIAQDVLPPVFSAGDDNAVPDPFDGHYVFSEDTTYNGTDYEAGDPFPEANPSDNQIEDNSLVTDYEYAGGTQSAIPDQYLMEYTTWNVSLGGNTGYRWPTRLGQLSVGTNLSTSVEYVTYDRSTYRPFYADIRSNWHRWQFVNRWGFNTSLDTRDLIISPSKGYFVKQELGLTGGFLLGDRHYIRTDTRGEVFFTLFDWPVFDNWNWKMVLAGHSDISFIFPQFWVPSGQQSQLKKESNLYATQADLLFIDGMFNARGWPRDPGYVALWNNWIELRMPLAEQVIWFDQFLDAAAPYEERNEIGQLGIENMRFSLGAGVRFTIPQFPIRLYLAKRFQFEDGKLEWKTGDIFNPNDKEGGGLEFVFSIGTELF
jgi:outer membrane protein insertion porin family